MRIAARYPPTTGPQSRSPSMLAVIGRKSVSARDTTIRAMTAMNLPHTRLTRRTGRVSRTSSVPPRCSSLHWRIVKAATRKIIRIGIHLNRGRTSAMFLAKKVSAQKKEKRVTTKKAPTKISAMGEPKYAPNSLRAIAHDCFQDAFMSHLLLLFDDFSSSLAAVASSLNTVSSVLTSRRSSRSGQFLLRARS